jgi:hypothetical protein
MTNFLSHQFSASDSIKARRTLFTQKSMSLKSILDTIKYETDPVKDIWYLISVRYYDLEIQTKTNKIENRLLLLAL